MAYITQMHDPDNTVEFHNLQTSFFTENGTIRAVDGVSFSVPKGKITGIVDGRTVTKEEVGLLMTKTDVAAEKEVK